MNGAGTKQIMNINKHKQPTILSPFVKGKLKSSIGGWVVERIRNKISNPQTNQLSEIKLSKASIAHENLAI